jgi:Tfp pilus assembly protein PilO
MIALALLAVSAAFSALIVEPLESRAAALKSAVRPAAARREGGDEPAAKVQAVYQFLARGDEPTDALATLHGIGIDTGVRLQSASYRAQKEGRVERLEIALPLTGSYAQIRDFAARALAEIPAASLDQLSLKREHRGDAELTAELRLTIHRVKS